MGSERTRAGRRMEAFQALGDRLQKAEEAGDEAAARALEGRANATFTEELYYQLLQAHVVLQKHRRRLSVTYAIYVTLSVALFVAGLALLATPFFLLASGGSLNAWSVAFAALGGAQTVSLLVFSPFTRLTRMMADMTQLLLLIEGHLFQVGLRLIEFDPARPTTVGAAALAIQQATATTSNLIQAYLEEDKSADPQVALLVDRLKASPDPAVRRVLDGLPGVDRLLRHLPPAARPTTLDPAREAAAKAVADARQAPTPTNLARAAKTAKGTAGSALPG